LLLIQRSYYHGDDKEKIAELLKSWVVVAENLGNTRQSGFRRNFVFDGVWRGKEYKTKQIEVYGVEQATIK